MDMEFLFTSGIASGVIVALTNYFITNKQLEKKMKEDREVLIRQYKQNVKLETYHYLVTKKMENIQNLHNLIIEKSRYNLKVSDLYTKYFNSKLPNKQMSEKEFNDINVKIFSMELGSKLIEKEISFNLNYFPVLKKIYKNDVDFLKHEVRLNIAEPMDIYTNHNGKNTFENKVIRFNKDVESFQEHTLDFIKSIEEEHESLIRQMEIDTN
ncbi:hypothetical protein [Mammaliicoccus fleurettii]|uniref:hypothetical protein n=1 Tax=Mammaliicoccus fleurettii TaxID=150056 RepID=UPI002DB734F1|nr:hypothetical protein [Mammaliicoccus fleurettii]MEB8067511.1 hypothetical protein [Mammaliicoccus fleurettii]